MNLLVLLSFCVIRFVTLARGLQPLFLALSLFSLFVISWIRPFEEGVDAPRYINQYLANGSLSHNQLITSFLATDTRDPMFYYASWLLAQLGFDERGWLGFIALIFSFSLFRYLRTYAQFPFLTLTLFVAFGYVIFSFSLLRQTIALSILFFAVPFLLGKRLIPFLLLVGTAALFHVSALVFALAWLLRVRISLSAYLAALAIGFLISIVLEEQIRWLISWLAPAHLAYYAQSDRALNYTLSFINLCTFAFCLTRFHHVIRINQHGQFFYNLSLIGSIAQLFGPLIGEFFRLAAYFNIFLIILVGWSVDSLVNRELRLLAQLGIISLSLLFSFREIVFYSL